MEIKNLAIHHVIKETQFKGVGVEQASKVNLELAKNEHPLNEKENISKLAEMLEDRVRSSGKGSSKLQNPSQDTSSAGHLNDYLQGNISFFDLSVKITTIFSKNMPATATGGYVTFVNYEVENTQMIFICVLKLEDGVTIDRATLTVTDVTSIQKNNIHEGVRINAKKLALHQKDSEYKENYIDWIKTKKGEKLSDYFQKIFDIDIEIDNTKQTTKFKKAADSYIDETVKLYKDTVDEIRFPDFSPEQMVSDMRQQVYTLVNDRAKNSLSLDFDDVNSLFDMAWSSFEIELAESFTEYASDSFSDLTNFFKPYAHQTQKWGTITHTVKSDDSSIKFTVDRALVRNTQFFESDEKNCYHKKCW